MYVCMYRVQVHTATNGMRQCKASVFEGGIRGTHHIYKQRKRELILY